MSELPILVFSSSSIFDFTELYLLAEDEKNNIIKSLSEELARVKSENGLYKAILQNEGFDISLINDAIKLIEDFKNGNTEDSEEKTQDFINSVVANLQPVLKDSRYKKEIESYKDKCKIELSNSVWDKLEHDSQNYLVNASFLFDQLSLIKNSKLDFSPVCILITKALEIEVSKRFFTNYISFLSKEKIPFQFWPKVLQPLPFSENDDSFSPNYFTLGKTLSITGLKNNLGIIEVVNYHHFSSFRDYYKSQLLQKKYNGNVDTKIKEDCNSIDVIRSKYRNPSAHKNPINLQLAEECIKYVISVQKKLYYFLKDLK